RAVPPRRPRPRPAQAERARRASGWPEDHRPGTRRPRARRVAGRGEPWRAPRPRQHVVGHAAAHLEAAARRSRRRARHADPEPRVRARPHRVRGAAGEAMIAACAVAIALQALAMVVDEGWFHRRRGLPRWERIGHPLDTLTIALCLAWLLCVPPSESAALPGYLVLAIGSTLFVTKDEG